MKLSIKIGIVFIILGLVIQVCIFVDKVNTNTNIVNKNTQLLVAKIQNLNYEIKKINLNSSLRDLMIVKIVQEVSAEIKTLPNKIKEIDNTLRKNLQQVNIRVVNKTGGFFGSGVSIKYKNNFYVLTAGHLADEVTDKLILQENGQEICELEVVKSDYTLNDGIGEDYTKKNDLLLLRPKDTNMIPRYYVEVADQEAEVGDKLLVVGNPMDMDDVVSDCRVATIKNNFLYYIGYSYFGNSGGGVFNEEGQLVGIVSHMFPLQPDTAVPPYVINGAVRLSVILDFLEGAV